MSRTVSSDPLVNTKISSFDDLNTVVIRFLSESNGSSVIFVRDNPSSSLLIPPFMAATTSAPSVGSPMTLHPSGVFFTSVLVHIAAIVSRNGRSRFFSSASGGKPPDSGEYPSPSTSMMRPSTNTFFTVICLWVIIPVLSEQSTVASARASAPENSRITTWRSLKCFIPVVSAIIAASISPTGHAAIRKLRLTMPPASGGTPAAIIIPHRRAEHTKHPPANQRPLPDSLVSSIDQ